MYAIKICEKSSIDRVEEKSIVDGGLHRREVNVTNSNSDTLKNSNCPETTVTLWGIRETLEKMEDGQYYLIIPNKNWKNRHGEIFAILTSENQSPFHRIDLVKLGEGVEQLEGVNGIDLTIGSNNKQEVQQLKHEYQTQIEVYPKNFGNNWGRYY